MVTLLEKSKIFDGENYVTISPQNFPGSGNHYIAASAGAWNLRNKINKKNS